MVEEKKEMKKGYVAPQMEILTIDFQGAPLCASGNGEETPGGGDVELDG